jgi:fatty acid/phospholipid biosynthesis enzyme
MGSALVLPRLNRSSAKRRPMVGSPQIRCMDEQVARMLQRSSMGRSEVAVRRTAISICTSVGSTVSDMIAAWMELQHVDGGKPEG